MARPALGWLAEQGFAVSALGPAVATTLLDGLQIELLEVPADARSYRALQRLGAQHGLLLRSSFRSARELRLAAPRLIGFKAQLRSLLLWRSMKRPAGVHKAIENLRLAQFTRAHVLGEPLPQRWLNEARLSLDARPEAIAAATQRLRAAEIESPYVVCCATAATRHGTSYKVWPGFPELYRRLEAAGINTVSCPGPGELERLLAISRPRGAVFDDVSLPELVAIVAASAATVSNDTGTMHIAAATGAKTLALFGDTSPTRFSPLSPDGESLGTLGEWPEVDTVWQRVQAALRDSPRPPLH